MKKKPFSKKYDFEKSSEKVFYTLQTYFLGIWGVLQGQGYLSLTSDWSHDVSEQFNRWKSKKIHFFQKETFYRRLWRAEKGAFSRTDFFQKNFEKSILVKISFWQKFLWVTRYFWTEWHCQNHDLRPGTRKSAKNVKRHSIQVYIFFTFSMRCVVVMLA